MGIIIKDKKMLLGVNIILRMGFWMTFSLVVKEWKKMLEKTRHIIKGMLLHVGKQMEVRILIVPLPEVWAKKLMIKHGKVGTRIENN